MGPFRENFDFILRRDRQKISYERLDYESVDERSLSKAMSRTNDKKKIKGKGLSEH